MERFYIAILALLFIVLQTTLIPQLSIAGIAPDLIFLYVIFLSLQRQTTLGIWLAFSLGLLQDIAGGGILGLNAFFLLVLAYLALYLRRKFFQENFTTQILVVVLFTFLHQFLIFFLMNTFLDSGFGFYYWLKRAFGMSIYHALLGPVLFIGLRKFIREKELADSSQHRHRLSRFYRL